jgi:hypothetical protein
MPYVAWAVGRLDLMIAAIRAGQRVKDPHPILHYYRGVFWASHGKHKQAVAAFEKSIELGMPGGNVWRWLGRHLTELGEFTKARDRLRGCAYKNDPEVQEPLRLAERLSALEPQLDRIVAGELEPEDGRQARNFGRLCHHRGKHAAATRWFRVAEGKDKRLPWDDAAASAVLCGETGQGLAWLRKYVEWNRKNKRPDRLRKLVILTLDPAFAPVRDDKDAPEEWRAFWAEIEKRIAADRRIEPTK